MMLNSNERAELYRKVRSVFVRHWIDLGRLSVHLSGTGLHLHGHLMKLPSSGAELSAPAVQELMDELARLHRSIRLDAQFDNWQLSAGNWLPKSDQGKDLKLEEAPQVNVITNPDAAV